MGDAVAAGHAGVCLPRRVWRHDGSAAPLWAQSAGHPPARPHAVRALADVHGHRRAPAPRPDGAGRLRRPDRQSDVSPTSTRSSSRRCAPARSSSSTMWSSTDSPGSARPSNASARRSAISRPTARTSIRSNRPSPSSKRSCGQLGPVVSTTCARSCGTPSRDTPDGMRPLHAARRLSPSYRL